MSQEATLVCALCFADEGITDFILRRAELRQCSFCLYIDDVPRAAPFDEVADHIQECLYREYDRAGNQLPYDGREGGFVGTKQWDTHDLILEEVELELPNDLSGELFWEICKVLGNDQWCEADAFRLNDDEHARYSWQNFTEVTKHSRRYFFGNYGADSTDNELDTPGEVLGRIFNYGRQAGLFKDLLEDTPMFRARWQASDSCLESPAELGPPPEDKATQSNRMSPPGVVMFYAAAAVETALLETANAPGQFAVGRFETLRKVKILDLTAIPPIPSLFLETEYNSKLLDKRRMLKFLRHVATQISRPIERDDRAHVEYVPTQVVTEFIRSQVRAEGDDISGIKYQSSVHPGHVSYVLFATQENILPANDTPRDGRYWLKLVDATSHSVILKNQRKQ